MKIELDIINVCVLRKTKDDCDSIFFHLNWESPYCGRSMTRWPAELRCDVPLGEAEKYLRDKFNIKEFDYYLDGVYQGGVTEC
ncbi:MAG: hypothetical protein AABY22_35260 [Nanoarchaeota archaeon]